MTALTPLPACPAIPGPSGLSIRTLRTLIVDDHILEREVMRRLLKPEPDIEVVGACANGREALEAIGNLKPDLVLLDVEMPELDGFGVVNELEPSNRPVFIFVTSREEFARRAFDVRALDFLMKPCDRHRLQIALQRARAELRRRLCPVHPEGVQ